MEDKKEKKNIFHKIQTLKIELLKANPKKSGKNAFAGFSYYELADFLPTIENLCMTNGLCTKVSFTNELATLEIINSDDPSERETYTSPMREITMKGTNEIQALGGVETYQRRYLYMSAFDITENDMFDGKGDNSTKKTKEDKTPSQFEAEQKEWFNLNATLKKYLVEGKLDGEELKAKYGSSKDMSVEQLREVIKSVEGDK